MQENMGKVKKTRIPKYLQQKSDTHRIEKKTFVDFKTNDEANA